MLIMKPNKHAKELENTLKISRNSIYDHNKIIY